MVCSNLIFRVTQVYMICLPTGWYLTDNFTALLHAALFETLKVVLLLPQKVLFATTVRKAVRNMHAIPHASVKVF